MNVTRRSFLKWGSGAALLASAGCGEVPPGLLAPWFGEPEEKGPFAPPRADQVDLIAHGLNRLTFGARPGDYERVRALGLTEEEALAEFVEQQLAPERIDDARCERALRRFECLTEPLGELFEYQPGFLLQEMRRATVLRATLTRRQLAEVMVQFWSDHFNVDPSKGDCQWLKAHDDREVIRPHALGRFPALLRASALSPAMLWYLDGRVNRVEHPGDKPNENYARELLELHTLGVRSGYTQTDVMEVARCLTGWTVRSEAAFRKGRVEFNAKRHDDGAKEVLGHRLPAGGGARDLDRVLDLVALHPATARHLATKLCRRFLADTPPQSAVSAVSEAFLQSRGDLRATLRHLFLTPEFRATRGNKFKRPFHFVVSSLRATAARTDAGPALLDYLFRMGHAPFNYPTPDGYPEESLPWLGTLLWRWKFALALSENGIQGTKLQLEPLRRSLTDRAGLVAHFLGRRASSDELASCTRSGNDLGLLLASPAFQRC